MPAVCPTPCHHPYTIPTTHAHTHTHTHTHTQIQTHTQTNTGQRGRRRLLLVLQVLWHRGQSRGPDGALPLELLGAHQGKTERNRRDEITTRHTQPILIEITTRHTQSINPPPAPDSRQMNETKQKPKHTRTTGRHRPPRPGHGLLRLRGGRGRRRAHRAGHARGGHRGRAGQRRRPPPPCVNNRSGWIDGIGGRRDKTRGRPPPPCMNNQSDWIGGRRNKTVGSRIRSAGKKDKSRPVWGTN